MFLRFILSRNKRTVPQKEKNFPLGYHICLRYFSDIDEQQFLTSHQTVFYLDKILIWRSEECYFG